MKKQIALIIISMLAAMSVNAQNVNVENDCKVHNKTPICQMGAGVIQPDLDEIFGNCTCNPDCETPDIPETPDAPELPDVPEVPEVPETPEIPEIPDTQEPEQEQVTPQSSLAMQVFQLVNNERIKAGLSALTYDTSLENAANIRAKETKTLFSHTRPNGQSCFTVLDEIGYSYRGAGENIAYGQQSAAEVMNAWMNSDGHRANILRSSYTHIGIGVYEQGGVIYWAQMFSY